MPTEDVNQEPVVVEDQEAAQEPQAAPTEQVAQEPVSDKPEPSEDDAMQAGFNAVNGIEEKVPEPEPEPEPPKLIAGYTEDEVKKAFATIAALEQRESKVFGSLGGLKQALDSLKSQQSSQPRGVPLTLDNLKKVSAEYPEFAKLLVEDLGSLPVGTANNPVEVEQLVEQRVQTVLEPTKKAYEQRFLTIQHPDWRQVTASEDFVGWKETLPEEVKSELDASWDAEFIGSKLTEFKSWKAQNVQTKQTNQRRLEAAITPKGTGVAQKAFTEEDALLAGWKAVRG